MVFVTVLGLVGGARVGGEDTARRFIGGGRGPRARPASAYRRTGFMLRVFGLKTFKNYT